jgi:hypothetical protein
MAAFKQDDSSRAVSRGRCYLPRRVRGASCMGNFFSELRRRYIYQAAVAYIVVAWVLLQLFDNLDARSEEGLLTKLGWLSIAEFLTLSYRQSH